MPGGHLLMFKQFRLETFATNGTPEFIVEAPNCRYDQIKGLASSPGHLTVRSADGQVTLEVGTLAGLRANLPLLRVADLLILRPEMPRSLISCYGEVVRWLDAIGNQYGRHGNAQRQARAIKRKLEDASIKQVFQSGLHEFVDDFITDNNGLAGAIAEQYLLG